MCYLSGRLEYRYMYMEIVVILSMVISVIILLDEKFLQCDWLRAVVFQLNLKDLHVKITTFGRYSSINK